ncbi:MULTISPECIES: LamG-like jellyroll fold domain-containing protein [unclassified Duganella]|uniref:LamG-like jellyroll fold domain-containing protein n=1 Tax=unclassified Duganella TaxID=2636909 RepID=UPI000E3530A0|nr:MULTISPECIES: DUF4038 domain-containing protein [unclassified Duganella]RFP13534.1 DUF4038 domain-containing protein [Duganella sp. BJB475]RFP36243.1 DUF4038 domain-containing protein [Duganella sp. BJB476]
MPYIKIENGVMQEYNNDGLNTGPVATIGLNAYSYLERRAWSATSKGVTGPSNPDYPEDFVFLQSKGIKYLQVMIAPFSGLGSSLAWGPVVGQPSFNGNSVSDLKINQSYWDAVQNFLDAAKAHNIGIIACPFWNILAIPQLVGEDKSALLQSDSKSRNYLRAFAAAFVARYKDHTGIAAWMAGQEITLNTGLDYNTAPAVLKEIAEAIRGQDVLQRMISSGNEARPHFDPRKYTIDEHVEIVRAMNPSPIDTLCENLFLNSEYFSSGVAPVSGQNSALRADFTSCSLPYLKVMQKLASDLGKPYYVGSFGMTTNDEAALQDTTQHNLSTLLQNFYRTGVQLACYWVWNSGSVSDLKPWNVLVTDAGDNNLRADVFAAITAVLDRSRVAPPDALVNRKLNSIFFASSATFTNTSSQWCYFTIAPKAALCPSTNFSISFSINQSATSLATEGPLIRRVSGAVNADARGWVIYKNGLSVDANAFIQLFDGKSVGIDAGNKGRTDVLDTWTRITFTVDANSRIALYVNDFLMGYTQPALPWSNVDGLGAIQIGRTSLTSNGAIVSWKVSDIVLYDRVLSPQEVFDYGVSGQVVNAAGRWRLNGDFKDVINANDGTFAPDRNLISFS